MKNIKYKEMSKFLIITLNALIVFGVLGGISAIAASIISGVYLKSNSHFVLNCIIFLIGTSSLLYILYNLRKILKSVIENGPFTMSNVRCLNKIAISCFVITVCYLINIFFNFMHKSFSIIEIEPSGIYTDTEFLIFFFAGLFVIVLAQIYKQAVEVKEENDFTI